MKAQLVITKKGKPVFKSKPVEFVGRVEFKDVGPEQIKLGDAMIIKGLGKKK